MKNLIVILSILFSSTIYSQVHIGAMGGFNLESEKTQVGVGLNYMLFPKVSVGAMAMLTPFDDESSDYMLMYNAKYKLGNFYLVGGLMDMKMRVQNTLVESLHTKKITVNHFSKI